MAQNTEQKLKAFAKVVAQAQAFPAFKERLVAQPNEVLKENGLEIANNRTFKVLENSRQVTYLPLPTSIDEADKAVFERLQFGQVILKAVADAEFKQRLLAHPEQVLKENGVDTAEGGEYRVVLGTGNDYFIVLLANQTGEFEEKDELSVEELDAVAGGAKSTFTKVTEAIDEYLCCY
ncbi:MAG TPA: hypothetical protein VH186_20405 [Chloroflexia bacterium]|nr:hypothetical protein [Chloroflexia bacterium]